MHNVFAFERRKRNRGRANSQFLGVNAKFIEHGVENPLVIVDEVHFVHSQHDLADSHRRRVCRSKPLRASTRSTARSETEAPTAMLRVNCSWPGLSATMKLLCFVEK